MALEKDGKQTSLASGKPTAGPTCLTPWSEKCDWTRWSPIDRAAPAGGRFEVRASRNGAGVRIGQPDESETLQEAPASAPSRPLAPPVPQQAPHRALGLSDETVVRQFELLLLARRLSERALKLSVQGRLPISIPSDGHEAAQIGSVLALRPQDIVHPFYRSMPA